MFWRKGDEESCSQCGPVPTQGRAKRVGAWIGLLFFCPCHLPLTIAGLLVMVSAAGLPGSAGWMRPVLFAVFGGAFVFFLVVVLRMAMRRRDQEREREAEHEAHHAPVRVTQPLPSPLAAQAVADEA